ncbi:hypothetical protein BwDG23_48470 [Bradyrhizobium ottawaense]|uniref:hypothetical protein n=3 Tax=Bradyrhizobium ottawaense TaxID=931866 RepID=UPI0027D6A338|nr:hypothetical protein BwSG10_48470 [Bradyrhizobium ottawaense]GMP05430.1 hypothetical protein BwDG23_48470 [Bradyrhizobium ottawaense]
MKFRLIFEGAIPPRPRATLSQLHDIRLKLAPQLETLWSFEPLAREKNSWLQHPGSEPRGYAILEQRGTSLFAPLISKRNDLQCELDVTFLRQQAPGQLIGDGGDIDNRVKTLLDALSVPPPAQADFFSTIGPNRPIYCLLQDDGLVIKLTVETDRLLRPAADKYDLFAILHVTVRATRVTFGTLGLLG